MGKNGFSLIEVLIVLTIMGVFALVATPSIIKTIQVARVKATQLELQNLDTVLNLYFIAENHYPENLMLLLKEGYLKNQDALKDGFGEFYNYSFKDTGYVLFSSGKDKKKNTLDDIYSENSEK